MAMFSYPTSISGPALLDDTPERPEILYLSHGDEDQTKTAINRGKYLPLFLILTRHAWICLWFVNI